MLRQNASEDDRLKLLVDMINDKDKALLEAKKGFQDGPQSFASRIQGHKLWIDEIQAQQELAVYAETELKTARNHFRQGLDEVLNLVATGGTDDQIAEAISSVMNSQPSYSEEYQKADTRYTEAIQARRVFTDARKVTPKKDKKAAKTAN